MKEDGGVEYKMRNLKSLIVAAKSLRGIFVSSEKTSIKVLKLSRIKAFRIQVLWKIYQDCNFENAFDVNKMKQLCLQQNLVWNYLERSSNNYCVILEGTTS